MLRLGMALPWSQGRIQVANEINEMVVEETEEPEAETELYVQLPLPLMPAAEYEDYGLAEEGEDDTGDD
jgi:hypothetical protein